MRINDWLLTFYDRALAVGCLAAGIVVLAVGWRGVSASVYPGQQIPYVISAGVGGLFLLGVAGTLWLSADLRDEWAKLDQLESAISALEGRGQMQGAVE